MERNKRRVRVGTVISDKMDKTIVVQLERYVSHPFYKKKVKKSVKYKAHDELNDANYGDRVRIMQTRPLSKTKDWRLVEIVERAK